MMLWFLILIVLHSQLCHCKKLKALCLHGYLSCGKLMKVQLSQLISKTEHVVQFIFPNAPHTLLLQKNNDQMTSLKSTPKCRWYHAAESAKGEEDEYRYDGIDVSLRFLMSLEKEKGPFDIIIGHSQGACLALTINALNSKPDLTSLILSGGEKNTYDLPNPMATILMSGFIPRDRLFNNIFQNIEINSKSLHLFSPDDDVVPPEISLQVMSLYRFPSMRMTVGGHDPSRDEDDINYIANYITNCYKYKYEREIILDN